MSILGFQLPGSLAPGASKIASGLGGKAASAGMFANPVGLALAGGQLAMGVANMIQQDKVATQQAYNSAYQTAYQNSMNQYRVEQQNKQLTKSFEAKVDFVQNQIENNFLAAQSSWTAEQMRLNDIYSKAAFQSQGMLKQLVQAKGAAGAREVYGKSARRGALLGTLGAYGRTRAQQAMQLMSETDAAAMKMQRTEQQLKAQNKLAIAQVSVLPQMAMHFDTPIAAGGGGGGFGQAAMQVAGLGMQAFQTGWGVTPSGGSFLGIQKA